MNMKLRPYKPEDSQIICSWVMNILGANWECIDMEMELEQKKLEALRTEISYNFEIFDELHDSLNDWE